MAEISGLRLQKLQTEIRWSGQVLLEQIGEQSLSIMAEQEWPLKSGKSYFVCITTGLLFDKQSGACRQSTRVRLLLETVEPIDMSQKQYTKWKRERDASAQNTYGRKSYSLPGGDDFEYDE